jgi:tRNA(Ile)-lysidine synthase
LRARVRCMLVSQVRRAAASFGLKDRSLLIAVSGGIDSMALAHAFLEIAVEKRLKLVIGHVNHGLRGEESDADQAAVSALAERLGLPSLQRRVDPEALRVGGSSRTRPTLQEAARTLRYQALHEMAAEADCRHLATAHNADDQAETVLLRLLRGCGPDGLGGIPPVSPDGVVVRPLLRVTRREIDSYAAQKGFEWREDASNAKCDYARNRLRLRWLPGLTEDFNPQLLRAIGDLAEAQRRDSDWIAGLVENEAAARFASEAGGLRVRAEGWELLPPALALRLVRWGLRSCGGARDVSRVHLERMLKFMCNAQTGSYIELPGELRLLRQRGSFWLGPASSLPRPGEA